MRLRWADLLQAAGPEFLSCAGPAQLATVDQMGLHSTAAGSLKLRRTQPSLRDPVCSTLLLVLSKYRWRREATHRRTPERVPATGIPAENWGPPGRLSVQPRR